MGIDALAIKRAPSRARLAAWGAPRIYDFAVTRDLAGGSGSALRRCTSSAKALEVGVLPDAGVAVPSTNDQSQHEQGKTKRDSGSLQVSRVRLVGRHAGPGERRLRGQRANKSDNCLGFSGGSGSVRSALFKKRTAFTSNESCGPLLGVSRVGAKSEKQWESERTVYERPARGQPSGHEGLGKVGRSETKEQMCLRTRAPQSMAAAAS
eukprot:CAMPEP_0174861652 /NCGR_PEP_ID=MMETSP1114-20130205/52099_1 /TAXON_ID=312471 /ORGANISM="Neobodo designis, Strain CCAP 1951/1" /LENGTH=207 /DNA_ID=CAMNT_0016096673 /DNA_START=361 /DNA_END=981 /DNA_ORIENTATION=+